MRNIRFPSVCLLRLRRRYISVSKWDLWGHLLPLVRTTCLRRPVVSATICFVSVLKNTVIYFRWCAQHVCTHRFNQLPFVSLHRNTITATSISTFGIPSLVAVRITGNGILAPYITTNSSLSLVLPTFIFNLALECFRYIKRFLILTVPYCPWTEIRDKNSYVGHPRARVVLYRWFYDHCWALTCD